MIVVAILLVYGFSQTENPRPARSEFTSLITGTVNVTVTWCGNGDCDPWESYYDCPQDCPSPWVAFFPPTPKNTVTTDNWVYVNVTLNNTANIVYLDWNGTNLTMSGSGRFFYRNMTGLSNGNYTFMAWANLTTGWNTSETRWVWVSYTPPPPPTPEPERAPSRAITIPTPPPEYNLSVILPVEPVDEAYRENLSLTNVGVNLKKIPEKEPHIFGEIQNCGLYDFVVYDFELPYQCVLVDTNLEEDFIRNLTIQFKVSRDWVFENDINVSSIRLVRNVGNIRQELITFRIGHDDDFIYFESLAYRFSAFLILAERLAYPAPPTRPFCGDRICDLSIGEHCGTCYQDCGCPAGESCLRDTCVRICCLDNICGSFLNICWYWWVIAIMYMISAIIAAVVAVILYKRHVSFHWEKSLRQRISEKARALANKLRRKG